MRSSVRTGAVALLLGIASLLATTMPTTPVAAAPLTTPPVPLPVWPERPAHVVLIGDSVAGSLTDAVVAEAARRGMRLEVYAREGCGITDGIPVGTASEGCVASNPDFFAEATAERADAVVVMSSWEVNSHLVGGRRLRFRSPGWDAWLAGQLDALRRRFGDVPLLVATVAPRAPVDGVITASPEDAFLALLYNGFLTDYAAGMAGSTGVVDVAAILCPDDPGTCPEHIGGARPRPDRGAHFDAAGGEWFAPQVLDAVERAWDDVGAVVTTPPGF